MEPGRTFSIMGYFCTKLRTRMSNDVLDVLVFLRPDYATPMKDGRFFTYHIQNTKKVKFGEAAYCLLQSKAKLQRLNASIWDF